MTAGVERARKRCVATLGIVHREGVALLFSVNKLRGFPISPTWVAGLNENMDEAETLEAFVSRFGRMQDTIGDKLVPRTLAAQAERVGSVLDNLAVAERLGWVDNAAEWLTARELRNRLVHEYAEDPEALAADTLAAIRFVPMLLATYNRLRQAVLQGFGVAEQALPPALIGTVNGSQK